MTFLQCSLLLRLEPESKLNAPESCRSTVLDLKSRFHILVENIVMLPVNIILGFPRRDFHQKIFYFRDYKMDIHDPIDGVMLGNISIFYSGFE